MPSISIHLPISTQKQFSLHGLKIFYERKVSKWINDGNISYVVVSFSLMASVAHDLKIA